MDAEAVLQLWEQARDRSDLDRAVALSAAVEPMVAIDEAYDHPLGHRNSRLLELRSGLAPGPIEMVTECPECGAEMEFAIEPDRVNADLAPPEPPTPIRSGDRVLDWRPITSDDLRRAAHAADPGRAADLIVDRCLVSVVEAGTAVPDHRPDDTERALLAEAIERTDPLCELRVELACIDCGHSLAADLDIAATVWAELNRQATRLVSEVHLLASTYGWTQAECLALTPQRRATYLEWVSRS